jgi:peptidoglycan/xylan/chitin deacetylase (PgdA/CDA1 family)
MRLPRFDRFFSICLASALPRRSEVSRNRCVPILMYHSISDDPETGVSPYYRLATPPDLFKKHLQILQQEGFRVVPIQEAVTSLSGSVREATKLAVITFDDGFRDFQLNAWPALQEAKFTATVFLPTAFIGEPRRSFVGRECLTWPEIRNLRAQGIHFGSHTHNHPKLSSLTTDGMREELTRSRTELERHIQEPITTFCHPYAFPSADTDYVKRYRLILAESGYSVATSTILGRAQNTTDPLLLPRLPINGMDDPAFFRAKLLGAYDWTAGVQGVVKRARRLMQRAA